MGHEAYVRPMCPVSYTHLDVYKRQVTIKANIDTLMGYTEPGRKQEKER